MRACCSFVKRHSQCSPLATTSAEGSIDSIETVSTLSHAASVWTQRSGSVSLTAYAPGSTGTNASGASPSRTAERDPTSTSSKRRRSVKSKL